MKSSQKTKPIRLIKLVEVMDITTLSATEVYRRVRDGTFPKQVDLGPKSVAWVESEIYDWCERLIAERDSPAPKPDEDSEHAQLVARENGVRALGFGCSQKENPYPEGSLRHEKWSEGWLSAHADSVELEE